MLDHTGIVVSDLEKARRFYDAVAAALGLQIKSMAPAGSARAVRLLRGLRARSGREQHRGGVSVGLGRSPERTRLS